MGQATRTHRQFELAVSRDRIERLGDLSGCLEWFTRLWSGGVCVRRVPNASVRKGLPAVFMSAARKSESRERFIANHER